MFPQGHSVLLIAFRTACRPRPAGARALRNATLTLLWRLGFRPIVVRECVGDRVAGAIEWNLFDIDAKFGDVEALDDVVDYLERVAPVTARDVERAVRIGQD